MEPKQTKCLALKLRASDLKNVDGIMGDGLMGGRGKVHERMGSDHFALDATDAFFEINNSKDRSLVRSDVMMDHLNPDFPVVYIPINKLVSKKKGKNEENSLDQSLLYINFYDWEASGRFQFLGNIKTSVQELKQKAAANNDNGNDEVSFELMVEKEKYGNIHITQVLVEDQPCVPTSFDLRFNYAAKEALEKEKQQQQQQGKEIETAATPAEDNDLAIADEKKDENIVDPDPVSVLKDGDGDEEQEEGNEEQQQHQQSEDNNSTPQAAAGTESGGTTEADNADAEDKKPSSESTNDGDEAGDEGGEETDEPKKIATRELPNLEASVEPIISTEDVLILTLKAKDLKNVDGLLGGNTTGFSLLKAADQFWGKTDSFFELTTDDGTMVVRSKAMMDDLNPEFPAVVADLEALCAKNIAAPIGIHIYDYDANGEDHKKLGHIQTTVQELLTIQAEKGDDVPAFEVKDDSDQILGKWFVVSAELAVAAATASAAATSTSQAETTGEEAAAEKEEEKGDDNDDKETEEPLQEVASIDNVSSLEDRLESAAHNAAIASGAAAAQAKIISMGEKDVNEHEIKAVEEAEKRAAQEAAELEASKKRAEEEAAAAVAQAIEEAKAKQAAEEEAAKKKAEEEAQKKAEKEAEAKRLEAEAIAKKAIEEAEATRLEAEAVAKKAIEEAKAKKKAEEEAAEAKRLAEEAAAKKKAEEEAAEEAKRLAEEAAAKKKAEEEAEAKRLEKEAAAKKKAEEEEAKRLEEEEAAAAAKKAAEEAEAKRRAEEDAAKKAAEEAAEAAEAKRLAEEEATKKAAEEAEAKQQAEEEAKKKATKEEEAKKKEEEESKRLKAVEAAKKSVEEMSIQRAADEAKTKNPEQVEVVKKQKEEATATTKKEEVQVKETESNMHVKKDGEDDKIDSTADESKPAMDSSKKGKQEQQSNTLDEDGKAGEIFLAQQAGCCGPTCVIS